ncbi:ATP-binding response regulator [Chitinibacter tainanensis]|uniref:ATP-binding response regulator n=1 Tax=Chitinibacter tainanensis TaxID=230667 RepID=UPI0003FB5E74|nr:response regulator [Chitinibacter tainanensis]
MALRKENVLIVDDQTTFRQTLKSILSEQGFTGIEQASSGREALQILKKQPINCIISDWNMPGMDGLELLQWVRNQPGTAHIPFMLITANATRSSIEAALENGVTDYLIKPFTTQHFANRMHRMLLGKRSAPARPQPASRRPLIGELNLEQETRRASILIVDDAKDNIEAAATVLEDDYQLQVALSGNKALELARSATPPDLILLDVMMPEPDGYAVCQALQADPATRQIPIIFMTAKDQPDDVAKGLEMGAVDYVVKPFHPTILRARVRTQLRLAKAVSNLQLQSARLEEDARLREEVEQLNKHDLKSPLSAVLQATEQLLTDGLTSSQQKLVRLATNATHAALEQIDRTLDLLRMETGSYLLDAEVFELGEQVRRVAAEVELAFAGKISMDLTGLGEQPLNVLGNTGLSLGILSNLLKNAAEAAPEGSQIHCSATVGQKDIQLAIHNQGAVPMAIRQRFFEKYVTAGKAKGNGIGTYTARLYAEAQHGSLEMQTDDDTGTTLTLRLPRQAD